MNHAQRRAIITRAFLATGKDEEEGLIRYIDQLERAILSIDKQVSRRLRARSRSQVDQILGHWYRREQVLKETE